MANLSGHDSHGVGLVPRYLDFLRNGDLKQGTRLQTILDAGALLTLDGGMGLGQVNGYHAMNMALDRARQHGVCVLSLRNSCHLGRIGHWAEQAARAGMVSIHFVNVIGRPALVAPWGGTAGRFSTNPFCFAMPRPGKDPIVLDCATSRIAHGKTRVSWKRGVESPPGNLLDAQGSPTNDPSVMWTEPLGALLPFGEHKGSGLGLICELFAGALSGAGTIPGRTDWKVVDNNMLAIVIDPAKLGGAQTYAQEVERVVEWVKSAPLAPGFEYIRIAGDPEQEARALRRREGVTVDAGSWAEILAYASTLEVDPNILSAVVAGKL